MAIAEKIAPHLPYLRRFARALCGSQESGDAYVVAVLESLVEDPSSFSQSDEPRVALYSCFLKVWNSVRVNQSVTAPLAGRPQQNASSEKGDLHDLETADVYTASSGYARSASANSTVRVPRPPSPPASTSTSAASSSHVPPPSYSAATGSANSSARPSIWNADGTWEEWDSR